MTFLIGMFIVISLLMVGISYPLIQRKIKPNPWYGFRTPRTLRDPEIWYPINEYMARRLLVSGLIMFVLAIVFAFIPNITEDGYALLWTFASMIMVGYSVIASFLYLRRLP